MTIEKQQQRVHNKVIMMSKEEFEYALPEE
jgi:hypothetical protein